MSNETKILLMTLRRALIMALSAIDDLLERPRTIESRRDRSRT